MSNEKGSRVGIILEGPNNVTLEQALKFNFKASNNQVEYKALIVSLKLTKEVRARKLRCYNDVQLVQGHVTNKYQALDDFDYFEMYHVPRESNMRVDLLSKLAYMSKLDTSRPSSKRHSKHQP